MYYILNIATSHTHFFKTLKKHCAWSKSLPYGLIHFQYLIMDMKSLPAPEEQTAIARLPLSLHKGKRQSTTVAPVPTNLHLPLGGLCLHIKKY